MPACGHRTAGNARARALYRERLMSLANCEQNLADFRFTFWEGNALRLSGDFGLVTQVRLDYLRVAQNLSWHPANCKAKLWQADFFDQGASKILLIKHVFRRSIECLACP